MKIPALNPYRAAGITMALFGAGHTYGALLSNKSYGPQADAVMNAMKSVQFACNGATCTWHNLYIGFGWFCSVFFLLTAFIMLYVGGLSASEQRVYLPLSWAFFCAYIASAILAWLFFFPMPVAFSIAAAGFVLAACLGTAASARRSGMITREPA